MIHVVHLDDVPLDHRLAMMKPIREYIPTAVTTLDDISSYLKALADNSSVDELSNGPSTEDDPWLRNALIAKPIF